MCDVCDQICVLNLALICMQKEAEYIKNEVINKLFGLFTSAFLAKVTNILTNNTNF